MANLPITRLQDHPYALLILVFGSVIAGLAANLYGLVAGVTIVIPHLLYIPIILVAFFYPRRGVAAVAGISVVYLLMVMVIRSGNLSDLISAGARCAVFITIAAVVSYLSERVMTRETALKEAKEDWERTFNAVPDLIAMIDRKYRIIRINRAMAQSLGIPAEQAVGRKCYEVVHRLDAPPLYCPHTQLLADGQEHSTEIHEENLGGDFRITDSPLADADGSLIGSVHVARDITEMIHAQQALVQANTKLNILSSITRHDILNKITALYAYLDLSRDFCTTPLQCEHIEKEITIVQALQRQVEFTKYYQDLGVRSPEWQDIEQVFTKAVSQIHNEGVSVTIDAGGYEIYADPLIEKVFYNLVENSLRHGEHATVLSLSVERIADGLRVIYRDNGVGIPADIKEKLFQRGFGKHTGLGLFLSREILAITGIRITENGEPGKGVRFEMTVPDGAFRRNGNGIKSPG